MDEAKGTLKQRQKNDEWRSSINAICHNLLADGKDAVHNRDVKSSSRYRLWFVTFVISYCVLTGCGSASHQIVGTWRVGDDSSTIVWEFSNDGSVLMGTNRGRYSFGDNNRIKIETSIATSVYQMELVDDKMTLKDPNGSKLVLTKVK